MIDFEIGKYYITKDDIRLLYVGSFGSFIVGHRFVEHNEDGGIERMHDYFPSVREHAATLSLIKQEENREEKNDLLRKETTTEGYVLIRKDMEIIKKHLSDKVCGVYVVTYTLYDTKEEAMTALEFQCIGTSIAKATVTCKLEEEPIDE